MSAWSDATKNLLIEVDKAIATFVTNGWQSGSPEPVVKAWNNFLISESLDAEKQGYGRRGLNQNTSRGFRDVEYFIGNDLNFLKGLKESDATMRSRIHLEVDRLVNYFAPWDSEENEPKARGYVGADGLTKNADVNRVRFRVLDNIATIETKIAEAKAIEVTKAADDFALSLGVDVSRGTTESINAIYQDNKVMVLAGAGVLTLVAAYLIFTD